MVPKWLDSSNYKHSNHHHILTFCSPMPKEKQQRVMSSGEVVELLGVSYQYIDKLTQKGLLPYQKTFSGKIFLEEDVLVFKKNREQKAKKDPRIKLKKSTK